jgi:hypothetical protein
VRFEADHEFAAEPAVVADVFCDPGFQTALDLPDLSRPEVVTSAVDGTAHLLALRYAYTGQLDGIAQKIVGDRALTWVQELRFDTATGTGTLSYSIDGDAGRLKGEAQVAITAVEPGRSRRHIAGDLRVKIPVVGGRAERAIVPGLVRRIDVEAHALADELARRS